MAISERAGRTRLRLEMLNTDFLFSLLPTGPYIAVVHASIAQRNEKGGFVRKLVLKMSVSVDGFVGGPNGEIDWIFGSLDDAASAWILDTLWDAGCILWAVARFAT